MPFVETPLASDNPHLRKSRRFRAAAEKAVSIKRQIHDLEAELDELKTQKLEPELVLAGVERVKFGVTDAETGNTEDWQFGIVNRKAGKRLVREKLIAACERRGYDLQVIEEGSIETEGSHYVEIRGPREENVAEKVRGKMRKSFGNGGAK